MGDVRRAFLFASVGRYAVMAISLTTNLIVARILSPGEFGLSVLGSSAFAIAEGVRELGSPSYLVQQETLSSDKIHTIFTINLIMTGIVAAVAIVLAAPLGQFYETPSLAHYVRILVLAYATGPFVYLIMALLSRDMSFHRIAAMDVVTSLVGAMASVLLVIAGFGYISLAWATVASSAVAMLMAFLFWRDLHIFRFSLKDWRGVLAFGVYGSITAVLYRTGEALSYLIVGKLLEPRAVGLLQRTLLLAYLPEKVILAGVGVVALPTFSGHVRERRDLKASYLNALEYITAIQWPALLFLIVLAEPIVLLTLGPQWREAVPLVRIISAALLANYPSSLGYPLLVAVGGVRRTAPLALLQVGLSLSVVAAAAGYGLQTLAMAIVVLVPVNMAISLRVVRAHVPFQWREFALAVRKSAIAAGMCAAGLLSVVAAGGWRDELSSEAAAAAASLGAAGWLVGMALTRHPLLREFSSLKRQGVVAKNALHKLLLNVAAARRE